MATRPMWVSRVDDNACEVNVDTQAHLVSNEVRHTTHETQPNPRGLVEVPKGTEIGLCCFTKESAPGRA